ncbi:hypothetical protein [Puia dinghuensis]|uniref:Uncharacterized protein n=1 Tax=Puia dinghuensis TaxID=1792502 RepID=A0A8J2UK82_9BACT|nr:hypothetical protein [Puia dinghuensis]GGB26376.1 hypothetical protein GCM10011511_57920 [Puia dinghuensis]
MAETIKNVSAPTIKKIKGNYHVGDIFHTVNNYNSRRRKIQFEPVTTGLDIFADYPKPHFLDEIFKRARTEQLLLVGGNSGFNKGQLLKYVAVNLKTEGLEVKECSEFEDFYSLSTAIQEESKRSVFILYNITAEAISYRFADLKSLIRTKDHILLGSTEATYDSWMFNDGVDNPSWFQIPERSLYSKEELQSYLRIGLRKKGLDLPVPTEEIVTQLSGTEQVDMFIDLVAKSDKKAERSVIQSALEISAKDDHSGIEPWFYSLSNVDKLIVIGISLFDNAYEGQVFAGYDRLLDACWKQRNKDLRPIDYEDLIPLGSYFKAEGKLIHGAYDDQRRKVIQMAWRTHKRYILSVIPELVEMIRDSMNPQKYDLDLFGSMNHRLRLRSVLSDTLSDIGLQSFEDINLPLLIIASNDDMVVQLVTAEAISRWKPFDEDKIYEVLKIWQEDTAKRLLESTDGRNGKKDENKEAATLLSNVRGTIALTLCLTSYYEKENALSPKITGLLLEFLHNEEAAIVDRMQFAVENITARHPTAMNHLLRDEFLRYSYYIAPISKGLVTAYYNGLSSEVRAVLYDWLAHCKEMKDRPEERDRFDHRESILSAVIYTLKYLDYETGHKTITIAEAFGILEELRKNNHNINIRQFVLDAIVQLIGVMFYSTEQLTIKLIPNIDASEREEMVWGFREKYLTQRQDLEGGEYYTHFGDYEFDTWSKPDNRPRTPVEKMLAEWKLGNNTVLTQIALESFVEFQEIEATERRLIDGFEKEKTKEEKEKEKKRLEYEKKGLPAYEGEIKGGIETEAFVKLCAPFVDQNKLPLLRSMYSVAVFKNLKEEGADEFITHLDDKDSSMVKKVVFIYKLFRNGNVQLSDNPAMSSFKSALFVTLASTTVPVQNKKLLKAFAPLLVSVEGLTTEERNVVFTKIKSYKQGWLKTSFTLAKNPILFLLICIVVLYLVFKILKPIF